MAKLNVPHEEVGMVKNLAGGKAYKKSAELELAGILLTSFFSGDTYYESNEARAKRLRSTLENVDPNFAAKAAIYARDNFGMRTSSHLVALYLAKCPSSVFPKQRFFEKVIIRPDDMLEIAAGILSSKGAKLPNAVKRAFARVLTTLDLYRLTKYRAEGKAVNIYDLINLTHPKETPAIKSVITGKFSGPATFEVALTKAGQNVAEGLSEDEKEVAVASNKKEAWKKLVLSGEIGYFALLRNLRNIVSQADEETQEAARNLLVDPKRIKNSRIFPFRYWTAYENIEDTKMRMALSQALEISCKNIPQYPGNTLVVVDESGSMGGKPREIACLFAAAFKKGCPSSDVMFFSDSARYVQIDVDQPIMHIIQKMPYRGAGTDFNTIFKAANKAYDRIVIFSDMQGWMNGGAPYKDYAKYRNKYSCDPIIYSIDLQGHSDMMFREDRSVCLAGWSDKIFDLMSIYENGLGGLVQEINKVEL